MNARYLIRQHRAVWWVVPPNSRGFGIPCHTFDIAIQVGTLPHPRREAMFEEHYRPLPVDLAIRIEQMDESRFPDPWKVRR